MNDIAIVGTSQHGLRGKGKLHQYFLSPFVRQLFRRGYSVGLYPSVAEFISQKPDSKVVVAVYNEEHGFFSKGTNVHKEISMLSDFLEHERPGATLVNSPKVAEILSSKHKTNALYSENGIPVPGLVTGKAASPVFSNDTFGSKTQVYVRESGEGLDESRYNTRYVNTARAYLGNQYHVCLRALCFGGRLVSIYIRARSIEDGSPSVHSADTPRDAELLNHLFDQVVQPGSERIKELCKAIGMALGPGFYAHDILPCAETGELFVCESGFKFSDSSYKKHMEPIRRKLSYTDFPGRAEAQRMADALIDELRPLGSLPDPAQVSVASILGGWINSSRFFNRNLRI